MERWDHWQARRPSWDEVAQAFITATERYGDLNIALLCGKAHNIVVVDADDEDAFTQAVTALGLREVFARAPQVKTKRGRHYYFRYPDGVTIRIHKNPYWGAELRGDGAYVVAPPSVVRHEDGTTHQYRWVGDHLPELRTLPVLPDEVLVAFGLRPASAPYPSDGHGLEGNDLPDWARALVRLLTPLWQQGMRHDAALALAGVLAKRRVSRAIAEAILRALTAEAKDPEVKDRLRTVADTYERLAEGDEVKAWSGLRELLGDDLTAQIEALVPHPTLSFQRQPHVDFALPYLRENFRWVIERRKWLQWDGRRWRWTEEPVVAAALNDYLTRHYAYLLTDRSFGDRALRKDLARFLADTRYARQVIASVLDLTRGLPEIAVSVEDLDSDGWVLNILNGTLDLRTGELRPHRKDDLITKLAPVTYDPDADDSRWRAHIEMVLPNPNVRRHVQRSLGVALVGAVLQETLEIWWGSGANGKTTTARIIMSLLGDYAKRAAPKLLVKTRHERHPTEIADLAGARLVFSTETERGEHLAEALVKELTGGDPKKARFMRADFFTFPQTFSIFLLCNHKPVVEGVDDGIWRRIHVVPWTVTIPEDQRRPQDEVVAELATGANGSAVLNWLLAGLRDWQQDPRWVAPEVVAATEEYREENCRLWAFVREACEVRPTYTESVQRLYDAYVKWCQANGENPLSKNAVGRLLREMGFRQTRIGHGGPRHWLGLRLKPDWLPFPPLNEPSSPVVTDGDKCSDNPTKKKTLFDLNGQSVTICHQTPTNPSTTSETCVACPQCGWWRCYPTDALVLGPPRCPQCGSPTKEAPDADDPALRPAPSAPAPARDVPAADVPLGADRAAAPLEPVPSAPTPTTPPESSGSLRAIPEALPFVPTPPPAEVTELTGTLFPEPSLAPAQALAPAERSESGAPELAPSCALDPAPCAACGRILMPAPEGLWCSHCQQVRTPAVCRHCGVPLRWLRSGEGSCPVCQRVYTLSQTLFGWQG